jgi:co-chaperonin GroES (HSP10)
MNDGVLVKRDPPQPRSSIIIAPGDEGSAVRTGTVLRVGPGKSRSDGSRVPMEAAVGDRITFLRWHDEHRPGKAVAKVLKDIATEIGDADDVCLIKESDILFVFEGDLKVDIA